MTKLIFRAVSLLAGMVGGLLAGPIQRNPRRAFGLAQYSRPIMVQTRMNSTGHLAMSPGGDRRRPHADTRANGLSAVGNGPPPGQTLRRALAGQGPIVWKGLC